MQQTTQRYSRCWNLDTELRVLLSALLPIGIFFGELVDRVSCLGLNELRTLDKGSLIEVRGRHLFHCCKALNIPDYTMSSL